MHTEGNFNFRADKNVNIEALQNVNIRSGQKTVIDVGTEYNLHVESTIKIRSEGDYNHFANGNLNLTSKDNLNLYSLKGINATATGGDVSLLSYSGTIYAGPGKVKFHAKGPEADFAKDAIQNTARVQPTQVPSTGLSAGWGSRYQLGDVPSFVPRVPMHEPWTLHDSYNPNTNSAAVSGGGGTAVSNNETRYTDYTVITFSADVWFDFDKDSLKDEGKKSLTEFATKYKEQTSPRNVVITGHTDSVGSPAYNQNLSVRRAESVKTFLVSQGLSEGKITTAGKGATQPIADNKTEEGRAKNRRVEIRVDGSWVTVPQSGDNSYLVFTSGSGDAVHFAQLTNPMQNAMRAAAAAYFDKFKKKVIISSAFRDPSAEADLYNRWIQAGGGPNRPTAGGITTPVKPGTGTSPHTRGIAVDSPNAAEMDSSGCLSAFGLYRPFTWDPNHIQLR
jgi:outer membrane protein OmpA-like peptidoglycan-associated protein